MIGEIERQRRLDFEEDLKLRYEVLNDRNAACHQSGISNPDLYFNQQILYNKSEIEALANMVKIEDMDEIVRLQTASSEYLRLREEKYRTIDKLLLEALAEKEEGNPAKMEEYLEQRSAIKLAHPKPVV